MKLKTEKQKKYFKTVIKLHYELGYGEDRISKIVPIGHSTVSRWIAIFAAEEKMSKSKPKSQKVSPESSSLPEDAKTLRSEISRLRLELKQEKLRADAYDEMINIAEAKFNVPIRKKAGAKRS
jgi:transposase